MFSRRLIPLLTRARALPRSKRQPISPRTTVPQHCRASDAPCSFRSFASSSKSVMDEKIEEIQDQYATAKDEFEIAAEETEKMTVYAQEDRNAAREELDSLKSMFEEAAADPDTGDEIRKRVGQRIRELESAVKNLEELAQHQD